MGIWGTRWGIERQREKENGQEMTLLGLSFSICGMRGGLDKELSSHVALNPREMVWGAACVPKCSLLAKASGLFPLGKS